MTENKTKPTSDSVQDFIHNVEPAKRRADARAMLTIMRSATSAEPVMWGTMVGFGAHHYKYESGREGDIFAVGFALRKTALVVYGVLYYAQNADRIAELGEVTTGKSCIYIKDLSKVNTTLLQELIAQSYREYNNTSEQA